MSDGHRVRVEVDQNKYLPEGGRHVNAVVSVTVDGGPARGEPPSAAQVIVIDGSASMAFPHTKLPEAKRATVVAISALRDGTAFAVVLGTDEATMVYPRDRTMVAASPRTRAEAATAVDDVTTNGGTRIGRWLTLAAQLLAGQQAEVKHVILLTDGRNERESPDELRRVLDACAGAFVCDCRGIGRDWRASELLMIAEAMTGTADGLTDPAALTEDFRAMTEKVMGKVLTDLALRLWTPVDARIRFVKQVYPGILDLTDRVIEVSPRVGEYPIGAWGAESRDYHVFIDVEPDAAGVEMLAARVSVVRHGTGYAEGRVLAVWTDDEERATRISRRVAHYAGQVELAEAIQAGMAARRDGNEELATTKLRRAMQLATESGDAGTAESLARVVDVDDERGTVRLRKRADNADVDVDAELATVRSNYTVPGTPTLARTDGEP